MKTIELTRGKVALVDDADYEMLTKYKWQAHINGYATTNIATGKYQHRSVTMHRFIMGEPQGVEIDHIDGNKLNNKRGNLRQATRAQNARNSRTHREKASKYKGVTTQAKWQNTKKPWIAFIYVQGKKVGLGMHETEEQAAYAYDVAALKHFGEYAQINGVPECELKPIKRRSANLVSF